MKLFAALILFSSLLFSTTLTAQHNEVDLINNELIDLANFDGESSKILVNHFSDRRLIGLGEATHGTSDFFKMKSELIKSLIINNGFGVVIFEGSYASSSLINNYIINGDGNVYNAIFNLGPWAWYTEEVLELIEWLKTHNESLPSDEKVVFYGCDMQGARSTAKNIIEYLQEQGDINAKLLEGLQWIQDSPMIRNPTKDQSEQIKLTLAALEIKFQHISPTTNKEQRRLAYNRRILQQWAERLFATENRQSKRDEFMAENCLFILKNEPNSKAILWAHNVHIAKNKGLNQLLIPMGTLLTEYLKGDYYALGFGFNSGQFTAQLKNQRELIPITVDDAKKGSSDLAFSQYKYPSFFLDFKQLKNKYLSVSWLDSPTLSRNMGATYYKKRSYRNHVLTDSYDGIIFIRETKASQVLDFNLLRKD